jgi:hypothetical protein
VSDDKPSNRSTSLGVMVLSALGAVATTQIKTLSPTVQAILIAGIVLLGVVWIVASAHVKAVRARAGQPSAGAGMVAMAPHAPAIAEALKALAALGGNRAAPAAPPPPPPPTPPDPTRIPPGL